MISPQGIHGSFFSASRWADTPLWPSRALGADIVFAGAPKWSVDPGECEIDADTVRRNFRDGMQGMGVRPDQVQGQIYVACDPADREDAYNLTKITEYIPDIHYIPVFHAEHVVMKSLNGSAVFGALIRTLLTGDPELLRRFISDVRRKNPTNIRNRLAVGHARHPLLCYHMVNAFYARAGDTFRDLLAGEALISLLIYRLIRAGYNREARDLFASATSLRLTGRRATAPRHSGPDAPRHVKPCVCCLLRYRRSPSSRP
ncbi:hypothetical protein GOB93_11335 [Acetobacter musti]|uniref:Uncharacterized protein n=1 Tax=Acetobacter musti TaxID=864732 RepID=A0ABX0JQH2_9PROT|nr:hypothetical protein [Acetobacter musti]NHN85230.1 hypothetical protein [Acetobacter musti]